MAALYHTDGIASYLEECEEIINRITILECSFLEIEVLKPIYTAITMLDIHIFKLVH